MPHRCNAAFRPLSVIRYEHPLNERIRTLMRLEDLYHRAQFFAAQADAPAHHAALSVLFEITESAPDPLKPCTPVPPLNRTQMSAAAMFGIGLLFTSFTTTLIRS